jgi:hypothetical protein
MKAGAVTDFHAPLQIRELPLPEPAPDQAPSPNTPSPQPLPRIGRS